MVYDEEIANCVTEIVSWYKMHIYYNALTNLLHKISALYIQPNLKE